MASFPDDYACTEHLAKKRWPSGFVCPHCASLRGWRLEARPWVWECAGKGDKPGCRRQTSVIAGTVILSMGDPDRLDRLKAASGVLKMDILELLATGYGKPEKKVYERKRPARPTLAPRRPGEERFTGRYRRPPRPHLEIGTGHLHPLAPKVIEAQA